jgi:predicted transcriptional regulator
MAGVYKLEIDESVEELKQTLAAQKSARAKERVQLLYLLKTGHATTVQHGAQILDRNRVTVQTWLRLYREGGMEMLLEQKRSRKTQCRKSCGQAAPTQSVSLRRRRSPVSTILNELTNCVVASIARRHEIIYALSVVGFYN